MAVIEDLKKAGESIVESAKNIADASRKSVTQNFTDGNWVDEAQEGGVAGVAASVAGIVTNGVAAVGNAVGVVAETGMAAINTAALVGGTAFGAAKLGLTETKNAVKLGAFATKETLAEVPDVVLSKVAIAGLDAKERIRLGVSNAKDAKALQKIDKNRKVILAEQDKIEDNLVKDVQKIVDVIAEVEAVLERTNDVCGETNMDETVTELKKSIFEAYNKYSSARKELKYLGEDLVIRDKSEFAEKYNQLSANDLQKLIKNELKVRLNELSQAAVDEDEKIKQMQMRGAKGTYATYSADVNFIRTLTNKSCVALKGVLNELQDVIEWEKE